MNISFVIRERQKYDTSQNVSTDMWKWNSSISSPVYILINPLSVCEAVIPTLPAATGGKLLYDHVLYDNCTLWILCFHYSRHHIILAFWHIFWISLHVLHANPHYSTLSTWRHSPHMLLVIIESYWFYVTVHSTQSSYSKFQECNLKTCRFAIEYVNFTKGISFKWMHHIHLFKRQRPNICQQ